MSCPTDLTNSRNRLMIAALLAVVDSMHPASMFASTPTASSGLLDLYGS